MFFISKCCHDLPITRNFNIRYICFSLHCSRAHSIPAWICTLLLHNREKMECTSVQHLESTMWNCLNISWINRSVWYLIWNTYFMYSVLHFTVSPHALNLMHMLIVVWIIHGLCWKFSRKDIARFLQLSHKVENIGCLI